MNSKVLQRNSRISRQFILGQINSATVGPEGNIPQEAAKNVLMIAALLIIIGGILHFILKKKRNKSQ